MKYHYECYECGFEWDSEDDEERCSECGASENIEVTEIS